ncbi:MAG: tetratricopeptide repeat protein [candidate division NC10 bacterium]|nr:tetratricopeptide repeat protein [candidate division NC10 bacterium]
MTFDKRKTLQNALTFTQQGKWDRAIAEYQAILKADPRDLAVCNNLGDLYARAGRAAEAIEQYLKLGELYRADGLSVKAIAVYKKIVKLDSTRTEAHLACADLYEEQGLTGEAKLHLATVAEHYTKAGDSPKVVEIYQRLAQLDPANPRLLAKVGDLLLKEGMREAAAAEYERASQAAQAAGQIAESKRLLQKVRELAPDSAEANLSLAGLHLQEGKYAEAVEILTRVTAGEAANAQAWRLLGEAHFGLGQTPEALTALEQAVALGVPEREIGRPLATALVQAGRTDDGITLCQKITEDALIREEPDEAITLCRDLLAVAPQLAPLHAHLAGVLHQLGRDEEARSATGGLAAAHEACGEIEAAIQVYRQLLERDPSDAEARERLEILEGRLAPPAQPAEQEDLAIPTLEAGALVEEPPALAMEEAGPAEPPVFDLSLEESPTLEVEATLQPTGEAEPDSGLEPAALSGQIFTLDESADLANLRLVSEEATGESPDRLEALELPSLELPAEEAPSAAIAETEGISVLEVPGLESPLGETEAAGEIAEQLAEAEVYFKYGLIDKARERLLEVVRLAPDNLMARRRLKALYLERPQVEEACGEILAIARILAGRGQLDAAVSEIQAGLALTPDHPELQGFLATLSAGEIRPAAPGPAIRMAAELIPIEAPDFEIPESIEIPEGLSPDAAAGPGSEREAPAEGAAGPIDSEFLGPPLPESDLGGGPVSAQEEELPPELRALLEEPGDEPALVLEMGGSDLDQAMADDRAEADFYLSQGMVEEARAVHRRMQARAPNHPAVAQLGEQLQASAAGTAPHPTAASAVETSKARVPDEIRELIPDAPPEAFPSAEPLAAEFEALAAELPPEAIAPEAPVTLQPETTVPGPERPLTPERPRAKFTVLDAGAEAGEGFVNLGAELEEELAAEEPAAPEPAGGPLVADLVKEFQKGVREQLDEKDYETHYNLGIAYKEMELYDEAIQEFRLAGRDPERALTCANLLGLCFLAKGEPEAAIRELRAGLEIRGHPRSAYHGLRYDLGLAHETQGDLVRSLEAFEVLQAEDARFRDVGLRVRDLRDRLRQVRAASVPAAPGKTGPPPKRAREKQKIAFI